MDACIDAAVTVEETDTATGRRQLNELTNDLLGIPVDEFLTRLERGDYDNTEDDQIVRLKMLAPFAG
jgi:hypothetical protein